MKNIEIALVLAMAIALPGCGGGIRTDESEAWAGKDATRCEMRTLVKADYCPTCKGFCGASCPMDDKGKCKACGHQTQKVDACVRLEYACQPCGKKHDAPCRLHEYYGCCASSESKVLLVCSCGSMKCPGNGCAACKEKGGCKMQCQH